MLLVLRQTRKSALLYI